MPFSSSDISSAQNACCSLDVAFLNQRVSEKPLMTLCLKSTSVMSAQRMNTDAMCTDFVALQAQPQDSADDSHALKHLSCVNKLSVDCVQLVSTPNAPQQPDLQHS